MSQEQVDSTIAQMFTKYSEAKNRQSALLFEISEVASKLENVAKRLRESPYSLNLTDEPLGKVSRTGEQTLADLLEDLKRVHAEINQLHTFLSQAGKGHLLKD